MTTMRTKSSQRHRSLLALLAAAALASVTLSTIHFCAGLMTSGKRGGSTVLVSSRRTETDTPRGGGGGDAPDGSERGAVWGEGNPCNAELVQAGPAEDGCQCDSVVQHHTAVIESYGNHLTVGANLHACSSLLVNHHTAALGGSQIAGE